MASIEDCAALPTRLNDARNLASKGQISKADPAHLELSEIAARSSADAAAMVTTHLEFRLSLALHDE